MQRYESVAEVRERKNKRKMIHEPILVALFE
jgi:hypothetical protein